MNEIELRNCRNISIFESKEKFDLAVRMASSLSNSTIIPKEFQENPHNALIAIELANRLQTSPLMVMQNLYIVYGRPSWSAQYVIAMINSSGKYDMELQFNEITDKNGKPFSCQCWTERSARKVTGPIIDMDMAETEGWIGKNGSKWKTMPQIMLRYRAASFFGRMNCPDLMMGMYTREEQYEIGDLNDSDNVVVQVKEEIQRNSNREEFSVSQLEESTAAPIDIEIPVSNEEVKEPVPAKAAAPAKGKELPMFMQETM